MGTRRSLGLLLAFCFISPVLAYRGQRCLDAAMFSCIRNLEQDNRTILGKVCSILDISEEILIKVCDLDFSATTLDLILEKVCDIDTTTSITLEKVCDIEITTSEILRKVCDLEFSCSAIDITLEKVCEIQATTSEILDKVCDIQDTSSEILFKVCDLELTNSEILAKVCELQSSSSINPIILLKVCDIEITTSDILTKVCTIENTTSEILVKVCELEGSTTLEQEILDKVCTIDGTTTEILRKVCDIELTTSITLFKVCELVDDDGFGRKFPITAADIGTDGFTVTASGGYFLSENVTFTANANTRAITIDASDVSLDLGCFGITQAGGAASVDGIRVNSSRENINILGGFLRNFTRGGITVQSSCSLIKISGVNIFDCQQRGIELLGSASPSAPDILDSNISEVAIFRCCTSAATTNHGLLTRGCQDLIVRNVQINEDGNAGNDLTNVLVSNCRNCTFKKLESNDNSADAAMRGFEIAASTNNCTFKKCEASNNNAANAAGTSQGFVLPSAGASTNNTFLSCSTVGNTAPTSVDGFLVETSNTDNVFLNCKSVSNRSTGAAATALARGFFFSTSVNNSCFGCLALNNSAPTSTATFGARGFHLDTCTRCSLVQSSAFNQSTGGGSSSLGVHVVDGSDSLIQSCQSANHDIGFRLEPDNSLAHVFAANVASKNNVQYQQFPNGSHQVAATINNINARLTRPLANACIG